MESQVGGPKQRPDIIGRMRVPCFVGLAVALLKTVHDTNYPYVYC